MVASSDHDDKGEADKSAELGRLAAEMLLKSPFLSMNPTLVPPTAALAAATIVGFGLSTQLAGAFWGALQGATDVANRFAAAQDTDVPAAEKATDMSVAETPERAAAAAFVEMPEPVAVKVPVGKRKRTVGKVARTEDLKRISGLGPKLEQLLNGLGIRGLKDVAAWSLDDVERMDAALGVEGRIARDDWVGQAKKLTANAVAAG